MTHIEKVKKVRDMTLCPMNKVNKALETTGGDVDKAIELLTKEMSAVDVAEMAKRAANSTIVYGYVHGNKIGALISLASQTDFVSKNEVFLQLAKDLCIHIVSSPTPPSYINDTSIPKEDLDAQKAKFIVEAGNKPQAIIDKIVMGKLKKFCSEVCLLDQKFVKDDTITVCELINQVSAKVGEKIEVKKFIRLTA